MDVFESRILEEDEDGRIVAEAGWFNHPILDTHHSSNRVANIDTCKVRIWVSES